MLLAGSGRESDAGGVTHEQELECCHDRSAAASIVSQGPRATCASGTGSWDIAGGPGVLDWAFVSHGPELARTFEFSYDSCRSASSQLGAVPALDRSHR